MGSTPSGPYQPYLEHPTSQATGRPAGADAGVAGPGDRRCPRDHDAGTPQDAILLSPPAPWHRPPGTPSSSLRPAPALAVTVHLVEHLARRDRVELVGEDDVALGRERAGPQRPASRERQVVAGAVWHQNRPVVWADDPAAGDVVAVSPISGFDVDLVTRDQLWEIDPVDVVGRHADSSLVARPHRLRVAARAAVQRCAVDALFDCGVVAELGHADREVDPVERTLQAGIDDRRPGEVALAHLALPGLVQLLLLADSGVELGSEGDQEHEPDDDEQHREGPNWVHPAGARARSGS